MKQQINLYQPMFRRQEKVFSAVALLQTSGVVVLALLLIYGYGQWQLYGVNKELGRLKQQQAAAAQGVIELGKRFPPKKKSKLLEAEVSRLATELEQRKLLQKAFSGGTFGNTKGFSTYLEALARRHVEGMWLTRISIGGGGSVLGVAGSTFTPELVPLFIQRLSNEPVMSGVVFGTLVMTRPESDPRRVDFSLNTATGTD